MPFPNRLSGAQIAGLSLVGIGIILCVVFKDPTVRFAIYACFGIGAVLVFNEPLTKTTLKWNFRGVSLTLTGSVVLFGALALLDPIKGYFVTLHPLRSITVIVHGREGITDRIMAGHGSVIMYVNGEPLQNPIDYRGTAKFSNLRDGDTYKLAVIDSEPYDVRKPDSVYTVDDQNETLLEVYLKGINKVFGYVKYREKPVADAHVSIGMMDKQTDSAGRFVFYVPDSLQRSSYQVTADKAGFKSKMATAHPESDRPTYLFLEKE